MEQMVTKMEQGKKIVTATDIPSLLFQKPYLQPRGIMKYTIENYWQLSEHLRNGGTTFKDQHIQQSSYQTTKT